MKLQPYIHNPKSMQHQKIMEITQQILLLSLLSLSIPSLHSLACAAPVGVCYGTVATNLPPPAAVIGLLKSNGISRVRLFNPNPETLSPFSGTGIELMIGVPNEILPTLANGTVSTSVDWLRSTIFSLIAPAQLKYLAVGNEVLLKQPYYTPFIVPAILNLHGALQTLGLSDGIKLSTPHAASILASSYPPSSGAFHPAVKTVLLPLLQFLRETGAPLMVNVYPFFSYLGGGDTGRAALEYATFRSAEVRLDRGLAYGNTFDATVDAFVWAMEREGFEGIPVVVTETGWPTGGGEGGGRENAAAYNGNVARRAAGEVGTPKRPRVGVEVFLFGLFDENGKSGSDYEKHFGIFGVDGNKAYHITFT